MRGTSMKLKREVTLQIKLTLDSSELVMFNKGGMHKIELDEETIARIDIADKVEISVQLEKSEQSRFDHVHGEAMKHRAQFDFYPLNTSKTPTKEEIEGAKERMGLSKWPKLNSEEAS